MLLYPGTETEKETVKPREEKEEVQKKFLEEMSGEEIDNTSLALKDIEKQIETKTERWFELMEKMES